MEEMHQELTVSRATPLPEDARYSINNSLGSVSEDSLQEILSKGIGRFVICEMLIGVEDMVTRQGLLTSVGKSYFVLYNETNGVSTVCDMYSLKFAHFLRPGLRPYNAAYAAQPAEYLEVGEGFSGMQEFLPMSLSSAQGGMQPRRNGTGMAGGWDRGDQTFGGVRQTRPY
ncbi:MAG: hypothetical protein IJP37_01735 [Clostridia bacterium]|nr:hypothetical protein [Clostridia bacterium]